MGGDHGYFKFPVVERFDLRVEFSFERVYIFISIFIGESSRRKEKKAQGEGNESELWVKFQHQ